MAGKISAHSDYKTARTLRRGSRISSLSGSEIDFEAGWVPALDGSVEPFPVMNHEPGRGSLPGSSRCRLRAPPPAGSFEGFG